MSATSEYPSVELTEAGKIIHTLHAQVCSQSRRVHITRADCDDVCVMISRKELESLEHALGVVAGTQSFAALCSNLQILLQNADMVYAGYGNSNDETVGYGNSKNETSNSRNNDQ